MRDDAFYKDQRIEMRWTIEVKDGPVDIPARLKKGWKGRIAFVSDDGPAGRRYHITLDRVPGATFAVVSRVINPVNLLERLACEAAED